MSTLSSKTVTREEAQRRGWRITVMPYGNKKGEPAAVETGPKEKGYPIYYPLELSWVERYNRAKERASDAIAIAAGGAVEKRDAVVKAVGETTGLKDGAVGVTAKLLGFDVATLKLVLLAALVLAGVIVYKQASR